MSPKDVPKKENAPSIGFGREAGASWLAVVAAMFALIAPIAACFVVIHSLVGVGNLKRHYWLVDGLVISVVLNVIILAPLASPAIRRFAAGYAFSAAVLMFVFVLCGYGYWMIALMGV